MVPVYNCSYSYGFGGDDVAEIENLILLLLFLSSNSEYSSSEAAVKRLLWCAAQNSQFRQIYIHNIVGFLGVD